MMTEDTVKVHLTNPEDIQIVRTEEFEPEHFVATSYVLPVTGLTSGDQPDYNANDPTQILQLDLLRKETVLAINGTGQVWLAHSAAQAVALQTGNNQGADSGTLITSPATVKITGTAPLWAIPASGNNSGTYTNALNTVHAQGKTTSPGAGATIAVITAANLAANTTYVVTGSIYVDGTLAPATDDDNMKMLAAGISSTLNVSADVEAPSQFGPFYVTFGPAPSNISIQAIAAGTASSVYHAEIYANPYPMTGASGAGIITVGVLQSRRGA